MWLVLKLLSFVLSREKVLGEWQIADENDILVERET